QISFITLCQFVDIDCQFGTTWWINNLPPGTYTIHFDGSNGPGGIVLNYQYSNTGKITTETYNGEFFYDGFEENSNSMVVEGVSHTGTKFWNGNYTCAFTIPNSKNYLIQWWSYQ